MKYESIIIWYKNNVEDFHKILKIVPYNSNNKSVIIPRLSPIIIESCSLLDTVFFSLYKGNEKKPDIRDYKKYYNKKLKLSSIKTLFYSEKAIIIQPFEDWEKTTAQASPFWWDSYNKLKHDRSNQMHESTLENTVYSLVALNQFLARNVDFFEALYRHDLIVTNYNPEFINKEFDKFWEKTHNDISLENELFLTPFGTKIFKTTGERINTNIVQSNRLKKYFVKWG